MSHPSEVYARLLLPRQFGFPLWSPEPDEALPEEYQNKGAGIGDVGIITSDGTFDYLFNICFPADHPINARGVPKDFENVSDASGTVQISSYSDHHRPGTDIASHRTIRKTVRADGVIESNPTTPVGVGGGFHFTLNTAEGAILVLPDGGSRSDLRTKRIFHEQATKHGPSWYEYANNERSRMTEAGSLCLITGCDKAPSWGIASFSNASGRSAVSLQLNVAMAIAADLAYTYHWAQNSSADVRVDPVSQRTWPSIARTQQFSQADDVNSRQHHGGNHAQSTAAHQPESGESTERNIANPPLGPESHALHSADQTRRGQRLSNQCLFIRGFRISVRTSFLPFPKPSVKVTLSDSRNADVMDIFRRSSSTFASSSRSTTMESFGSTGGSTGAKSTTGRVQEDVFGSPGDSEDMKDVVVEAISGHSQLHDPLAVLNKWLLDMVPDVEVAVTHDEDFFALMEKHEVAVPDEEVIRRRASEKFDYVFDISGKAISLQMKGNSGETMDMSSVNETGKTDDPRPEIPSPKCARSRDAMEGNAEPFQSAQTFERLKVDKSHLAGPTELAEGTSCNLFHPVEGRVSLLSCDQGCDNLASILNEYDGQLRCITPRGNLRCDQPASGWIHNDEPHISPWASNISLSAHHTTGVKSVPRRQSSGTFRSLREKSLKDGSCDGWNREIALDGKPYFIREQDGMVFVTDCFILRPEVFEEIEKWRHVLQRVIIAQRRTQECPARWEVYLRVEEKGGCRYYMIDHDLGQVFWAHDVESSLLGMDDDVSPWEFKLMLQIEFWAHLELFPHTLPPDAEANLRGMLIQALGDIATGSGSKSLFSSEECLRFWNDLDRLSKLPTERSVRIHFIARLTKASYHNRLLTFQGKKGPRIDRAQRSSRPDHHATWSAIPLFLFCWICFFCLFMIWS